MSIGMVSRAGMLACARCKDCCGAACNAATSMKGEQHAEAVITPKPRIRIHNIATSPSPLLAPCTLAGMVGTRNIQVISYKELSDLDSDSDSPKRSTQDGERRKKKRAKLSRAKKTAAAAGSVSPFWTVLPLDVVYEVLWWLQPIDLLRLARSTKTLRSHLMSKVSLSVWKASRENVIGGTPECPEYMSEPAFARLLFANECFICGKLGRGSPGSEQGCPVYWEVQMRCCPNCLDTSFIAATFVDKRFQEMENIKLVVELLPFARKGQYWRKIRCYYIPAIYEMGAAIEDHENQILARVLGAQDAFEKFKVTQKTKVAAMLKDAPEFDMWHRKHERLIRDRNRELRAERREVFMTKLLAEGHHANDVAAAFGSFSAGDPLTENGWTAIRPKVDRSLARFKRERLKLARASLLDRRREVVISILRRHPVNTNITENFFRPSLEEVAYAFEPITLVVDREDDEEASAEDFEGALEGVEEWVEEWRIEKRTEILEIMVSAGAVAISDPLTEHDFARLKLATTMFSCTCRISIRYRDIEATPGGLMCFKLLGRHHRTCGNKAFPWNTECFKYSADAEEMIRQLVIAVGRNPETTTTDQMDELNARFYCQGCPKWDRLARSWRNCAAHFEDHPLTTFQGWLVVPPEDAAKVIRHETSNRSDYRIRIKCLLHHDTDHRLGYDFWNHVRYNHPDGTYNMEDIHVDPLAVPCPISVDGLISEPPPPPPSPLAVSPDPEPRSSRKRSRRRR
ncbi:hypothetical protein FRB95_012392 [Tulasnella sp. JGI-2019a]|nr:hypothetical protein FRB95_012392 [Tulasnella sp. JGI-2019a]